MTGPKPERTQSADVEASLCRSLRILFLAFLAAPADPGRRRSAAVRRFAALARLAARRHVPAKATPPGRRLAAWWAAGRPRVDFGGPPLTREGDMARGRRLLGRFVLRLVVTAFVGATLGLPGTSHTLVSYLSMQIVPAFAESGGQSLSTSKSFLRNTDV